MKPRFSSYGVVIAILAITLGPLYTAPGYDWLRHSVSELAAQNTRNAWIMQTSLVLIGVGILIDFYRSRQTVDIPLAVFAVAIILTGVFPHKPITDGVVYSESLDWWHSVFSGVTGFSAVVASLVRFFATRDIKRKTVYFTLVLLYTVLPMAMFNLPAYEGVFQRIIFGSFFTLVLLDFPWRRHDRHNTGLPGLSS